MIVVAIIGIVSAYAVPAIFTVIKKVNAEALVQDVIGIENQVESIFISEDRHVTADLLAQHGINLNVRKDVGRYYHIEQFTPGGGGYYGIAIYSKSGDQVASAGVNNQGTVKWMLNTSNPDTAPVKEYLDKINKAHY